MAKKKYIKPVMTSEAFVTDSYCAVCEDIVESRLVADCGECGPITFVVGNASADNGARYIATAHTDKGQVGSGHLLKASDGVWITDITMNDGCHKYNLTGGEYQYTEDTSKLGKQHESMEGVTYCSHDAITDGLHHHLAEKTFTIIKNVS